MFQFSPPIEITRHHILGAMTQAAAAAGGIFLATPRAELVLALRSAGERDHEDECYPDDFWLEGRDADGNGVELDHTSVRTHLRTIETAKELTFNFGMPLSSQSCLIFSRRGGLWLLTETGRLTDPAPRPVKMISLQESQPGRLTDVFRPILFPTRASQSAGIEDIDAEFLRLFPQHVRYLQATHESVAA